MILDSLYTQNDIIGSAMQAGVLRNEVITGNIANADTPGYKKKVVNFETYLDAELKSVRKTGDINLNKLKPTVQTLHSDYSYRLDGNNVDPEAEMIELYKNSARYDALQGSILNNYKRINLVLTGIK